MKKGFTLIELLAVILILGIIALIAIPTVNNILKESRLGAFEASARNIVKAAEEKCLTEHMKGNTVREFVFTNGKVSPSLDVKGDLPKSGIITLNENCEATATLTDGDRRYELTYEGSNVDDCTGTSCSFGTNLASSDEKYACFNFDEETGTILKYDGSNPVCQGDIYIPAMINNVPVVKINDLAFINPEKVICEKDGNEIEHEGTYIPKEEDGYCYSKNLSTSYKFNTLNMEDAGFLTEIGVEAFYYNELTSVNFNDNLKKIDEYAFQSNDIKKIVLPKNLVELGEGAFYGCHIEDLTINNKLKVLGEYSFAWSLLKEINIPEGVEYVGEGAFACGDYESAHTIVNISDTVIGIGDYAFMEIGATKVNLGKNVKYIGEESFSINNLTNINIPSSVIEIGPGAFIYNLFTENVFIYNRNSDGTENKKSINSFAGREVDIVIPNGVEELGASSCRYIGASNITLPEGLKYIRESALDGNNLTSITIPSTVEVIEKSGIEKRYNGNRNMTSIINKTGRSFDWTDITKSTTANQVFETGTITHQYGNITVTK